MTDNGFGYLDRLELEDEEREFELALRDRELEMSCWADEALELREFQGAP
jgi:hypothetical protein